MRLVDAFPRLLVVRTFEGLRPLGPTSRLRVTADADLLNTIASCSR